MNRLGKLGFSQPPPLIREAVDTYNSDHRLNCWAWHMLKTKSREEIEAWLQKNKKGADDMRERLNTLKNQVREMRRAERQKHSNQGEATWN